VTGLGKVVRAVIGLVVLVTLLVVVNGWYGEYKKAAHTKTRASVETSASVDSTQVVPVSGGQKVVILSDGVVLRATPATVGVAVRTLKKGETLILVGTAGSWLQLRDAHNGKLGYVTNSSTGLRVQK